MISSISLRIYIIYSIPIGVKNDLDAPRMCDIGNARLCMLDIEPLCFAILLSLSHNAPMLRRIYPCWALACCLLFGVSGLAQVASEDGQRATEHQLIALERLWNEAQVNHDASALANMIGDKFVNTEWNGEVTERGKFLADIADPRFNATSLNIQDVKVILYRDTAVVAGIYQTKGTVQGKPYEHRGRFTDTWVHQDARWLCVASHTSLLQK